MNNFKRTIRSYYNSPDIHQTLHKSNKFETFCTAITTIVVITLGGLMIKRELTEPHFKIIISEKEPNDEKKSD